MNGFDSLIEVGCCPASYKLHNLCVSILHNPLRLHLNIFLLCCQSEFLVVVDVLLVAPDVVDL